MQGMDGEMRRATRYGRDGHTSSFQCFIIYDASLYAGFRWCLEVCGCGETDSAGTPGTERKDGVCAMPPLRCLGGSLLRFPRCELERPARGAYSGKALRGR